MMGDVNTKDDCKNRRKTSPWQWVGRIGILVAIGGGLLGFIAYANANTVTIQDSKIADEKRFTQLEKDVDAQKEKTAMQFNYVKEGMAEFSRSIEKLDGKIDRLLRRPE